MNRRYISIFFALVLASASITINGQAAENASVGDGYEESAETSYTEDTNDIATEEDEESGLAKTDISQNIETGAAEEEEVLSEEAEEALDKDRDIEKKADQLNDAQVDSDVQTGEGETDEAETAEAEMSDLEYTPEKIIYTSEEDPEEDLLYEYLLFRATPSTPDRYLKSRKNKLNSMETVIYTILKEYCEEVASGDRSGTEFSISMESLGLDDVTYTAADLGVESIVEDEEITDEAMEAAYSKAFNFQYFNPVRQLLADCPYSLYWFDKSSGVEISYPGIRATYSNGEWSLGFSGEFTYSFAVAQEFSAGEYMVNSDFGQTAETAAENIASIVSLYQNANDEQKLIAYKNEICDRVSYNNNAAQNNTTPYGNPWQLLWVFDDDPNTTVVCEGYSKAFKALCDASNFDNNKIRTILVSGMMTGGTGAGRHMWNIVSMPDGNNYLVDITNCDEDTIGAPDLLFLNRDAEGDLEEGYLFTVNNAQVKYVYDSDTFELYEEEEISLADQSGEISLPSIINNPEDVFAPAGTSVAFNIIADGNGLTYQWQYQGTNSENWVDFMNGTEASLVKSIAKSWDGWKIRCIVTNQEGNSVISDTATITIVQPIEISQQPESVTAAPKDVVIFEIIAASNNNENLNYQWQYQGTSSAKWNNFANATGAAMTKTAAAGWNGWKIRCVVTDGSGNTVYSDIATITIAQAVTITQQPEPVTTAAGRSISFSVTASGDRLSYQWQYQGTSSAKWNNFANATGATMTKTAAAGWNGWKIRCVVTDGSGNSAYSDVVVITVN